jgi:hypothetical protein
MISIWYSVYMMTSMVQNFELCLTSQLVTLLPVLPAAQKLEESSTECYE